MFGSPPILRLRRSAQSGDKTMTVAWQTVYSQSQSFAWMFASGRIDLTNMIALDEVDIRVSSRQVAAGGWVVEDLLDYVGVQPVNKKKISIGAFVDTFGVLIEMRQTVGVLVVCFCEFSEAIR